MRGDGKKPVDAFLVLAKASFGDRRRRSPARIVVAVLLLVLLVALPPYLLWPGPERTPLLLAAVDQVALPGERVSLCARVEPLGEEKPMASLARCDLYFHEPQTDWRQKLATNRDGMATVQRSFSAADVPTEIMVRYPGESQRRRGTQAKARVFVWPAEASVLVVDVEHTLAEGDAETLWTANNLDVRPRPEAVAALRALRAKYRVGYLAAGADRPSRYNKLRAWLERGWAPEPEQFPDGPVLAPACRPGSTDAAAYQQEIVNNLKQRFRGAAVGITGHGEIARLFHEVGWQTFLLREAGQAPEGVTVVKSWSELNRRLP